MILSDQSVYLSLAIGVALGVLLVINKAIVSGNSKRWPIIFLADFTFTVTAIMLTFIISIPIYKGRIRFLQVALELIGALGLYYSLGVPILKLVNLIYSKCDILRQKIKKKAHKRHGILKKSVKTTKYSKKTDKKT